MTERNENYRMGRGPAFLGGAFLTLAGAVAAAIGLDMLDGTVGNVIPLSMDDEKLLIDLSVDGEVPLLTRLVGVAYAAGGGVTAVAGVSLMGRAVSK